MPTKKYQAVQKNVEGDFYVKSNCCTLCGVPQEIAPKLFDGLNLNSEESIDYCYVKKQPTNKNEIDNMIEVMATQDLDCVRYCGKNINILKKIVAIGESNSIDWNIMIK